MWDIFDFRDSSIRNINKNDLNNHDINIIDILYDKIIDNNGWICGGYPLYLYHDLSKSFNIIYSDIDIFCKSKNSFYNIKSNMLRNKEFKFDNESKFAYNYILDLNNKQYKIQVIKNDKNYDLTLENTLGSFDINQCMIACYKTNNDYFFYFHKNFYSGDSIQLNKNIKNYLGTFFRIKKYIDKGFTIDSSVINLIEDNLKKTIS